MTVRVTVDILNADAATEVATVDAIADATVQDMISGDSTGELSVGLESAVKDDLNAWGRVLRWNLDGEPVFHSIIEGNVETALTESHSHVPRQVTVSGRGLEAQFEAARVQQWPGMEQVDYQVRHFNYVAGEMRGDQRVGVRPRAGPRLRRGRPAEPAGPPATDDVARHDSEADLDAGLHARHARWDVADANHGHAGRRDDPSPARHR